LEQLKDYIKAKQLHNIIIDCINWGSCEINGIGTVSWWIRTVTILSDESMLMLNVYAKHHFSNVHHPTPRRLDEP